MQAAMLNLNPLPRRARLRLAVPVQVGMRERGLETKRCLWAHLSALLGRSCKPRGFWRQPSFLSYFKLSPLLVPTRGAKVAGDFEHRVVRVLVFENF